jgi:hypothetical protein
MEPWDEGDDLRNLYGFSNLHVAARRRLHHEVLEGHNRLAGFIILAFRHEYERLWNGLGKLAGGGAVA